MKKLVNIILALAAITFHSSCINEELAQDEPVSGIRVYSDWAETRTSHQSSNGVTSVSWVEGDKIGLFAENQYNLCYIAENSGSFSDFTASDVSLDAADGDKVFAYYPYEQWTDQDGKSFRLPRTQGQWSSLGMSRYDALYAEEAVSNDELNLKFKHVFSFLKITVPTERLVRDSESGYYVLRLVSNEMLSNIEGNFNVETKEFDANCTTDVLYIIDKDIADKSNVTCTVAVLPQSGDANISIYACADNFSVENLLRTIDVPQSGLEAGKVYTVRIIDEQQAAEREKSVEALTALYNATDGDNWKNNTNWLTDEPLYKWYGLNANYWPESTIEVDDIVEIQLFDNNLRGTLPSEFAYIMSKANAIEIENNGLHGVIPQEVREHPKWQKFGWNVIMQNPYLGGGFDFSEGTGLKLTDVEMPFFVENEARKASDVFAENELTLAVNVGLVDEMQGISEGVVDYYKKYQNKDLGMIVTVGGYWDYTYDEYRNYVLEERAKGLPEEIMWIGSQISSLAGQSMSYNGAMHLFDKESNLLGAWIGGSSESWEQIDAIVRERLGEPEVDGDSSEANTLELVSVTDEYDNYRHVLLQFVTPGVTSSLDTDTWQVTYTGTGQILELTIHAEKNDDGVYIPVGTYLPADSATNPFTWQITSGLPEWNIYWGTRIFEVMDGYPTMVQLSDGTVDVDYKDGNYIITYKGHGYELTYEGPIDSLAGNPEDEGGNDGEESSMLILASDFGQKVWKWGPTDVYGNAGHTGGGFNFNAPGVIDGMWWGCKTAEELMDQLSFSGGTAYGDEASGAYMVFSEDGVVTSYKPTGKVIRSGEFEVKDYDPSRASCWEIGKLITSEPALLFPWKVNGGGTSVTEYDIMYLTPQAMTLVYTGGQEPGSWGEITYWNFIGGSPDPLTIEGTWTYGANGYGNGGHTGAGWAYNAPGVVDGDWWSIANDDDFAKQLSHAGGVAAGDEFFDAYMVFEGNTVTTYSPDGTKIRGGEWTATMNDYALNAGRGAASWELGKLTTSEPALLFPWKVNGGGTPVTEYDIMYFDANNMTLVYTGEAASGGWGEITHWCFVRK